MSGTVHVAMLGPFRKEVGRLFRLGFGCAALVASRDLWLPLVEIFVIADKMASGVFDLDCLAHMDLPEVEDEVLIPGKKGLNLGAQTVSLGRSHKAGDGGPADRERLTLDTAQQ